MQTEEFKLSVKSLYNSFAAIGEAQDFLAASANKQAKSLPSLHYYTKDESTVVPLRARHLSSGCGNPFAAVAVRPGDSVMDMGCGCGHDVLLAARQVGVQGRVFGADLADRMVQQARTAAAESGLPTGNITLRETDIESRFLPKSFADLLIANNVITFCQAKETVFTNIFRVLRPGARLVVADIMWIGPSLTDTDLDGCPAARCEWIAGIMPEDYYWQMLTRLSFTDICTESSHLLTAGEILAAAAGWPVSEGSPLPDLEALRGLQGKLAAVTLTAVRPPLNC